MPDWFAWLRNAQNPISSYAKWRESYLQAHPEKRLFPWLFNAFDSEAPETSVEREPFITFTPAFSQKIGWGVALVILAVLLASDRQ